MRNWRLLVLMLVLVLVLLLLLVVLEEGKSWSSCLSLYCTSESTWILNFSVISSWSD